MIMLGVFLLAETLLTLKAWHAHDLATDSISVTGQGEVYAVPDVASFSFGVSADAVNVADAQTSVTKSMDTILSDLKNLGIEEKDVQTNDYSITPKYKYTSGICTSNGCPPSQPIPDGYTVTHSVLVKVRKTADAGKALAAVGTKGATNVSGISFTIDDPNLTQDQARAKAIDNAKAKAEELAKHLGVHLGRVIGYSDTNANGPYPMYDSAAGSSMKTMSAVAPTLPVGQNKVTANVTVSYEIR